jgi:NAD(P)-dependent dehydrogenase (short-subunit alcohol dehydrogenase family)
MPEISFASCLCSDTWQVRAPPHLLHKLPLRPSVPPRWDSSFPFNNDMTNHPGSILVTGTNGGLGSAIVKHIVSSPEHCKFHGIYTVRSLENPALALDSALKQANSNGHAYDKIDLDLAKLANVREVAATINKRVSEGSLPRIRALILNAGFQEQSAQSFSEDGFDMSFQANYLSHWLLTLLLLQSMDVEQGRIVVVGSSGHE